MFRLHQMQRRRNGSHGASTLLLVTKKTVLLVVPRIRPGAVCSVPALRGRGRRSPISTEVWFSACMHSATDESRRIFSSQAPAAHVFLTRNRLLQFVPRMVRSPAQPRLRCVFGCPHRQVGQFGLGSAPIISSPRPHFTCRGPGLKPRRAESLPAQRAAATRRRLRRTRRFRPRVCDGRSRPATPRSFPYRLVPVPSRRRPCL